MLTSHATQSIPTNNGGTVQIGLTGFLRLEGGLEDHDEDQHAYRNEYEDQSNCANELRDVSGKQLLASLSVTALSLPGIPHMGILLEQAQRDSGRG